MFGAGRRIETILSHVDDHGKLQLKWKWRILWIHEQQFTLMRWVKSSLRRRHGMRYEQKLEIRERLFVLTRELDIV